MAPVPPPVTSPPLPAALPSGVYQNMFAFLSQQFTGPAASEPQLRRQAKADARVKLASLTAQVKALPVPSPPVVRAQGPHVMVIQYDWMKIADPAGITVALRMVCYVWSEYP